MNRKRERLEIIRDVLLAIRDKGSNVRPTHILYRSNLSSEMLKQYLGELISNSFVIEEKDSKGHKVYSLLPKGFDYIKDYSVIVGFMESYGLE
jgi:predicted transcriptional regulator